jgi:hypothetical protein
LPLWVVSVLDADPEARRGDKTVAVKIMDTHQPVLPQALVGRRFSRWSSGVLTVTPYLGDKACRGPKGGEWQRCRALVSYSCGPGECAPRSRAPSGAPARPGR